jgi:hypothetical protein
VEQYTVGFKVCVCVFVCVCVLHTQTIINHGVDMHKGVCVCVALNKP